MKYIIDVDKDRIDCSGQLFIAVDIPNSQSAYEIPTGMWVKEYTESDRKAIEDEVWSFVDFMIYEMDAEDRKECFGKSAYSNCIHKLTYQEAKSKYDAWKKEKQKDEIRVGDEVETESGNKACILYENPDGTQMFVFKADGTAAWWSKCAIHKTGKNHPEIAELLKKMRDTE